jgi:MFS transporter, DHA3 family, macrolide efflux protein
VLSLLRNRSFFWLWLGQTISLVGDDIRDWAMIYWVFRASNGSPVAQSLAFIAVMAPALLLGPFAGVLVDRWDRRRTMLISDLLRGGISLLLLVAVSTGQYWYALVVVFLGSCVSQFFNPARGAMIPRVVGQEHLLQANSLSQTTNTLMQLAGPALGTAVFTLLGPVGSFSLDAASFFLSACCIAMVTVSGAVAASGKAPDFFGEMKSGLRYAWGNRPVRALMISLTVLFVGGGAINAMSIFIIRKALGLDETAMVGPSTASPLASVIAAIAIGAAAKRLRRAPLLVSLGLVLGAAGIGLTAGAPTLSWVIVGSLLVGLCNTVLNIGVSTTVQSFVPDSFRGRVFGVMNSIPTAAMLASAGAAGYLAETVSPRLILGVSAGVLLVAAGIAFAGLKDVLLPEPGTKPAAATAG